MYTETMKQNGFGCLATLLGRASLWCGVLIAAAWNVGFAIILRHERVFHGASVGGLRLPVEPPLIGLALAGLGLALAWVGRQRICSSLWAGLALNALPLVEALLVTLGYVG